MTTKIPPPDQAIYEWESRATLAPLTSSQKNSVHSLSVLVSRLSMPISRDNNDTDFLPQSSSSANENTTYADPLGQCVQYVGEEGERCNRLGKELVDLNSCVARFRTQYDLISSKSRSLHDACESLVSEQTILSNAVEGITHHLSYMDEIDRIYKRLESNALTGAAHIGGVESFLKLLAKLDECIAFVSKHPTYRDAGLYLSRAQQSEHRCLGLIREQLCRWIDMCVALVSEPLVSSDSSSAASPTPTDPSALPSVSASSAEPSPTPATASTLANAEDDLYARLYGRFRVHAPRVRLLAAQLEARASGVSGGFVAATQRGGGGGGPGEDAMGASRQPTAPATPATARSAVSRATLQATRSATSSAHYWAALHAIYSHYAQRREQLLQPAVAAALQQLQEKHARDHCAFVRSACAFLLHVCEDESQLFFQFFTSPSPILNAMQQRLCTTLYDSMRPLVIRVQHLETLAELCAIFRVEMLEDVVAHNSYDVSAFGAVCTSVLADVQERFVYRAHMYIRDEILNYKPAPGDLAYPHKLLMMQSITERIQAEQLERDRIHQQQIQNSQMQTQAQETAAADASAASTGRQHTRQDSVASLGSVQSYSTHRSAPSGAQVVPLSPPAGTHMPLSPADLYGMWYPTVRRALQAISKMKRSLDKEAFEGLAQEALSACIESLQLASTQITLRSSAHQAGAPSGPRSQHSPVPPSASLLPPSGLSPSQSPESSSKAMISERLDAQLFLVKHLLILREQIAPFIGAQFTLREIALDYSHFTAAAKQLFNKKSRIFKMDRNNALLLFLLEGTPAVREQMRNSRLEMDVHLKAACEQLIRWATHEIAGSLLLFLEKCTALVGPLPQRTGSSASTNAGVRTGDPSGAESTANAAAVGGIASQTSISDSSSPGSTETQTPSEPGRAAEMATNDASRSSEGAVASPTSPAVAVASKPPSALSREAFATSTAVRALVVQVMQHLRERWPALAALTHLYLANADTEAILLRPVRNGVIELFANLVTLLDLHYSESERAEVEASTALIDATALLPLPISPATSRIPSSAQSDTTF